MRSIINEKFIKAAQHNQLDELKKILNQGANIHTDNDGALRWASQIGYLEPVKFLIARGANIHANDDYALRWSASNGHLEIVKFLLVPEVGSMAIEQGSNIHANNDEALRWSAQRGHQEVCKVLSSFIQKEKLLVAAVGSMAQIQVLALGSTSIEARRVKI